MFVMVLMTVATTQMSGIVLQPRLIMAPHHLPGLATTGNSLAPLASVSTLDLHCNGQDNCGDRSDEIGCSSPAATTTRPIATTTSNPS
ncbi:hypothetical protein OS493_022863 [Desmophyllum pertusum]|uniref:Uncharacterized protein n=1 Tax=Desmophyllum pertusum TaxID=174260 RepID=A0A9W9ZNW9_9CNID|nr:hypothetical protein OS493_022863 [Desmophyllum pertusum]